MELTTRSGDVLKEVKVARITLQVIITHFSLTIGARSLLHFFFFYIFAFFLVSIRTHVLSVINIHSAAFHDSNCTRLGETLLKLKTPTVSTTVNSTGHPEFYVQE